MRYDLWYVRVSLQCVSRTQSSGIWSSIVWYSGTNFLLPQSSGQESVTLKIVQRPLKFWYQTTRCLTPHDTNRANYVTQPLRFSNTCPMIFCEITISSFYTKFTHVSTAMVYRTRTNWSNPRSALSSCAKTVTKFTSCLMHGIVYIQAPNLYRTLTEHIESVLETSGQDFLNVILYM
jgi:hypothetical protein